jgi:hypothetical protein
METSEHKTKKKRSLAGWLFMALGGIVFVILLAMLIAPLFLKGKLVEIAKQEINKNLHATVDFERVKLTFFRSFPSLTLDLKNFSLVNKLPFEGDTLFYSDAVSLTLDVMSVFRNEPYEIKRLNLKNPVISLKINEEGEVNWDVSLPESDSEMESLSTDNEPFTLNLRNIRIQNGNLSYLDRELDMDIYARGVNGSVSGRFSEDEAILTTEAKAEAFDLVYENFAWLKDVKVDYNAFIEADFVNSIYTLKRNVANLNDLAIKADGSFGFTDDAIVILLTFESMKSDFKSLLSLIPAVYATDFDKIETSGYFDLKGSIKGNYSDESMPGFNIALQVDDAIFGYTGLPSKLERINIKMDVDNKTGVPDATVLNLSQFDFLLDNEPFRANLHLKTPVSNPSFDANLIGLLNLQKFSQALPLKENEQLNGNLRFDISVKATKEDIEQNRFERITALGSLLADDIQYNSSSLGLPVMISRAQLNFAPAYIDLVGLNMTIGESDMQLAGRVQDYLAYFVNDGTIKGQLDYNGQLLDVNSLMAALKEEVDAEAPADEEPFNLDLPERMDLVFNAKVGKILYEQYQMNNAIAKLHYKDKRITFDPLSADLMEGHMQMKGYLDAVDSENPLVDFDFKIQKFDIPIAYQQIGILQQLTPVAEKTTGDFSTNLQMRFRLDRNFNPVYESIVGGGNLLTSRLVVQASDVLVKIADLIGKDEYKRLVTDGLNFSYEFLGGRVFQKPASLSYAGSDILVGGSVGFDQSIDYEMRFQLSFGQLGKDLSGQIQKLLDQSGAFRVALEPNTRVNVIARLSGDVRNPKIELDYKNFAINHMATLEEQARQFIDQKKEEVLQKLNEEAERIMAQAQSQVAEIMQRAQATATSIRAEAAAAADRLRSETEQQAARVEAEGKQRGPVAEIAARETAKRMRAEANNSAKKLIDEAEKGANNILQQAQNQSDEIMKNAQFQVDRLQ